MEPTEPQTQEPTSADSKVQTFIAALHALEQADGKGSDEVEALVALYAPDAKLSNSALRLEGQEMTGTDAIREFWDDYKKTMGKAYSTFDHITQTDASVGLFWVTRATAPNGEPDAIHYDGATLMDFDANGKIAFFKAYYDTAQLNRQMGLEKG